MKVLVTGANGQLGRDVVELFAPIHDVYPFGSNKLDVTDELNTRDIIHEVQPDIVIHTAAYTAVDRAQEDRERAYAVNVSGSKNVSRAASEVNSKICAISTDYVFDGQADMPYTELSPTNPRNVYGATKLAGEHLIRQNVQKSFIVRTSWLFGVHGNNFVKTMLRLGRRGQKLKVVADQIGSPTYTRDLAKFLLELVTTDYYGVYHVSNTGTCSWYEFACEIFRQTGLSVDLSSCTTEAFPRAALRPKYSVLGSRAIQQNGLQTLRPWTLALRDFLNELYKMEDSEV